MEEQHCGIVEHQLIYIITVRNKFKMYPPTIEGNNSKLGPGKYPQKFKCKLLSGPILATHHSPALFNVPNSNSGCVLPCPIQLRKNNGHSTLVRILVLIKLGRGIIYECYFIDI